MESGHAVERLALTCDFSSLVSFAIALTDGLDFFSFGPGLLAAVRAFRRESGMLIADML